MNEIVISSKNYPEPISLTSLISSPTASYKIMIEEHMIVTLLDDVNVPNQTVEIIINDYAQLTFIYSDSLREYERAYRFVLRYESILDFSSLITTCISAQMQLAVVFEKPQAQATIRGAYLLDGNQNIDIISIQEHKAPNTTSILNFKGALSGSSQASFNGSILIEESGNQTNAALYNKNILLSPSAHVTSIPNLEVKTNDVQCKHGSAIGQLDDAQLFYLQSRGFSLAQAQRLILKGFFANGTSQATHPLLTQKIDFFILNESR